ncbi:hypothetical protein [Roseibium sediminis]|uniref:hypothetical protein n=1 Tax=Roseibium sediminis TaxID=1775174 RepID=UPI00123D66CA|nr:hypothetical protein [Roseibium sediminis]
MTTVDLGRKLVIATYAFCIVATSTELVSAGDQETKKDFVSETSPVGSASDLLSIVDQISQSIPGSNAALELLKSPVITERADIQVRGHVKKGIWNIAVGGNPPTAMSEIILPVGNTVEFIMTSDDDIYEVEAPELGLSFDLIPGRITSHFVTFLREGRFPLSCRKTCVPESAKIAFVIQHPPEPE